MFIVRYKEISKKSDPIKHDKIDSEGNKSQEFV